MSSIKRKDGQRSWVIDTSALLKAEKKIGLQDHVTVTMIEEPEYFWWGFINAPIHTVELNPTIPVDKISWTLWHELAHARQCERDFGGNYHLFQTCSWMESRDIVQELDTRWHELHHDDDAYNEWKERYDTLPLEAEAERLARRYADKYPLAKAL